MTGATFMKFGRAPTTVMIFIGSSLEVCTGKYLANHRRSLETSSGLLTGVHDER
jgi:hypothetical protein